MVEIKKNKLHNKKARIAVLIAFFSNGSLVATWVSRIPAVQSSLNIGEGALGLVLLGLSSGMLAALLLVGGLIARLGSRKIIVICALVSCITLPFLVLSPHPILLFINLFIFGSGISAMDVAMNEQAVLVERNAGKPMMSSFHAGYSVGGVAGALVGAGMAALPSVTPLLHFLFNAIIFSGLMILIYKHLLPTQPEPRGKEAVLRLPERALWILGAVAFSGAIGEGASADWSAVYLTTALNANASTAALGFASFSLTMTIGRMLGDWLTAKLKPSLIVRLGGVIAALGFLAVVLAKDQVTAIIGFALVGAGLANIIPVLFSAAGNHPDFSPGTGIAGVATIGYTGFLIGPPLIGTLAEIFSLRAALFIVALIVGTLFFSAKAVKIEKKA